MSLAVFDRLNHRAGLAGLSLATDRGQLDEHHVGQFVLCMIGDSTTRCHR